MLNAHNVLMGIKFLQLLPYVLIALLTALYARVVFVPFANLGFIIVVQFVLLAALTVLSVMFQARTVQPVDLQ